MSPMGRQAECAQGAWKKESTNLGYALSSDSGHTLSLDSRQTLSSEPGNTLELGLTIHRARLMGHTSLDLGPTLGPDPSHTYSPILVTDHAHPWLSVPTVNSSPVCNGVTSYCDQFVPGANVSPGACKLVYKSSCT